MINCEPQKTPEDNYATNDTVKRQDQDDTTPQKCGGE